MWIVAKIKNNQADIFKKNLKDKFQDTSFYEPKIQLKKLNHNKYIKYEKSVMEDYIFCFNRKFSEEHMLKCIMYIKGLKYFLNGYKTNQKEISKFIFHCKINESETGYLKSSFFKSLLAINDKAKFVSGPFTNMFFEVIKKKNNKLKVLVGNIVTTINDNSNYIYHTV